MYKQSPGRMNMPKTGRDIPTNMVNPIMQRSEKNISARGNQAASDKSVEKQAEKKLKKKVSEVAGAGEKKREKRLARGAQKGTFFGLEKLFD